MTDELPIEREDNRTHGRYVVRLPDGLEAEMTYRRVGADVIDFNHTYVPPEFRNAGLAIRLVEAGIADARAEGSRVLPTCSYVAAQFRRHPAWADLRAPAAR